jgi:hypothetical protein
MIASKSTDQAKNRVTGPASILENSIPSGVLIVSAFILSTIIGFYLIPLSLPLCIRSSRKARRHQDAQIFPL